MKINKKILKRSVIIIMVILIMYCGYLWYLYEKGDWAESVVDAIFNTGE